MNRENGSGWLETVTLGNASNGLAALQVNLFDTSGRTLALTIGGILGSSWSGTINPLGSQTLSPASSGSQLQVGWMEILSSVRLVVLGRIGTQAGLTKVEAVTQASSGSDFSIAIPFDNTNGYLSSVAIANTGGVASTVTFTAADENGAILATDQLPLGLNAVSGIVLRNSYPALNGRRGLLIFTGTSGLSGIGFLFNATGSFSTEPVTALN